MDWIDVVFGIFVATVAVGIIALIVIATTGGHDCTAPYHQVYTGTQQEIVGKVWQTVDTYKCVHN